MGIRRARVIDVNASTSDLNESRKTRARQHDKMREYGEEVSQVDTSARTSRLM